MTSTTELSYEQTLEHLHGLLGSRVMAATRLADDLLTPLAVVGELSFGRRADLDAFATECPQLVAETILFRIGTGDTGGFFTISRSNFLRAALAPNDPGSTKLVVEMHGRLVLDVRPASDFEL